MLRNPIVHCARCRSRVRGSRFRVRSAHVRGSGFAPLTFGVQGSLRSRSGFVVYSDLCFPFSVRWYQTSTSTSTSIGATCSDFRQSRHSPPKGVNMFRFFRPILQFQGGQHLPEWQFCLWITFINHDPERSVLEGQLSPIYPAKANAGQRT
jgi:hypothetical protein